MEAFVGKCDLFWVFYAESCCNRSSYASWRFMRVDSSNIPEICKYTVIFHDIWHFFFYQIFLPLTGSKSAASDGCIHLV